MIITKKIAAMGLARIEGLGLAKFYNSIEEMRVDIKKKIKEAEEFKPGYTYISVLHAGELYGVLNGLELFEKLGGRYIVRN